MVQPVLRDIRNAIQSDDRERVVELVDSMLDAFEQGRAREQSLENAARSIRVNARSVDSDATAAAHSVIESSTKANQAKINVDTAVLNYIGGEDDGTTVETLENAIETHDTLDQNVEELQTTAADLDLPPAVGIAVPDQFVVPKGKGIDSSITVRNDGTTDVDTITIDLETEAEISLSTSSVDDLGANETVDIGFSGTLTTADVFRPTVSVSADEPLDTESFYLHVQNKRTYLEQAIDELVEMYSEMAAASVSGPGNAGGNSGGGPGNSGGGPGNSGDNSGSSPVHPGLENKVKGIAERTVEIIGAIEQGTAEQSVNNQIGSVINRIQALINQMEALSGKALASASVPRLRTDAEAIIEVYENGQVAAP